MLGTRGRRPIMIRAGAATGAARHPVPRRALRRHRDRLRRHGAAPARGDRRRLSVHWVVLSSNAERARRGAAQRRGTSWPARPSRTSASSASARATSPGRRRDQGLLRGAQGRRRARPGPHPLPRRPAPGPPPGLRAHLEHLPRPPDPGVRDPEVRRRPRLAQPLRARSTRRPRGARSTALIDHFPSQRAGHWFDDRHVLGAAAAARHGVPAPAGASPRPSTAASCSSERRRHSGRRSPSTLSARPPSRPQRASGEPANHEPERERVAAARRRARDLPAWRCSASARSPEWRSAAVVGAQLRLAPQRAAGRGRRGHHRARRAARRRERRGRPAPGLVEASFRACPCGRTAWPRSCRRAA